MCGPAGLSAPSTPKRPHRALQQHDSTEKAQLEPPSKKQCLDARLENVKSIVVDEVEREYEQYPLVARERQCKLLDQFLEASLAGKQKSSLYVSGGPGTGKTCCVRGAAQAWQHRHRETAILHVNCMELSQRSVVGLLKHLAFGSIGSYGKESVIKGSDSGPGLVTAAAARLSRVGRSVILIVDEVDQLVGKPQTQGNGICSLDTLFKLTHEQAAPAIAIVAIANAVDLLERGGVTRTTDFGGALCKSLLFLPYGADELRKIVRARLDAAGSAGTEAEQAIGKVAIELRVRQIAKRSGDCRPLVQLCEQALFEAAKAKDADLEANDENVPNGATKKPPASSVAAMMNDPLKSIRVLPMEQQILLFALASAKSESVSISEICARYKDFCKQLHQSANLASKGQVSDALTSLEQRGLLAFKSSGAAGRRGGCAKKIAKPAGGISTVELAVSRSAVKESIMQASPLLKRCLE